MFKNNSIIITNKANKNKLLNKLNKQLLNIKIYTISEIKKLLFFTYNEETIYYVKNKYSINSEIARIYINNIYNVEDKKYNNEKLNFLTELKKDLLEKKLIKENKLFIESLKNKTIILYNIEETKELDIIKNILKNNDIEIINEESNDYKHTIYELQNIEDEVVYVANKICELINNGIDINKIYLTNLNSNYRKIIKKVKKRYFLCLKFQ